MLFFTSNMKYYHLNFWPSCLFDVQRLEHIPFPCCIQITYKSIWDTWLKSLHVFCKRFKSPSETCWRSCTSACHDTHTQSPTNTSSNTHSFMHLREFFYNVQRQLIALPPNHLSIKANFSKQNEAGNRCMCDNMSPFGLVWFGWAFSSVQLDTVALSCSVCISKSFSRPMS